MNLTTFGPVEDKVLQQMENCLAVEEGSRGVLCADNHLGFSMPIGGVVAYREFISPSACGYDIACGNAALRTDVRIDDVNIPQLMDEIQKVISFGIGRKNNEKIEDASIDLIAESKHPFCASLAQMAAGQFGTIGSGNHFLNLMKDDEGFIWIAVHFGSRGFGHKTASWALEQAGTTNQDMMAPPTVIPINSELAHLYIQGMELAGAYAYAARDWVCRRVLRIIGGNATDFIHNHHNYAWRETHDGVDYWVHRKGSTPANPNQVGFVGANMRDASMIVRGVESDLSRQSLYSTVHGAGRIMSRTQAAGKVKRVKTWRCGQRKCSQDALPIQSMNRGPENSLPLCPTCGNRMFINKEMVRVTPGLIDFDVVQKEMRSLNIVLRGAGADEAAGAYKKLDEVIAHHEGTIDVVRRLYPVGVIMAGSEDGPDPYKD